MFLENCAWFDVDGLFQTLLDPDYYFGKASFGSTPNKQYSFMKIHQTHIRKTDWGPGLYGSIRSCMVLTWVNSKINQAPEGLHFPLLRYMARYLELRPIHNNMRIEGLASTPYSQFSFYIFDFFRMAAPLPILLQSNSHLSIYSLA